MSSSIEHCKFLTRNISFSSTAFHTHLKLMKWHRRAYALSVIRLGWIQILGRNGRHRIAKRSSFPSSNVWLLNALLSCIFETKYLQLNVQYRIVPQISELENILSHCNIRSLIVPASRVQLTHPELAVTEYSTICTAYLGDMWFEHITSHAVWIDTYISVQNTTSTILTHVMGQINDDFQ